MNSAVRVVLREDDLKHAASIGFRRQMENLCNGLSHRFNFPRHNASVAWGYHIEAAIAEKAVAVYLELPWNERVGDIGVSDVGTHIEVRSTDRPDGSLIVHETDRSGAVFVLVINNESNTRVLAGWICGYEAKRSQFWQEKCIGRPAYFVPQGELHDMRELKT